MKYQKVRKVISLISSFSLLFQSFLPLAIAMPAYAEDSTPSAIVETTATPTPTVEITPETTPEATPTLEPTPSVTPTPTIEVTPEVSVTPEPTPEPTPEVSVTPEEVQNNSPPTDPTQDSHSGLDPESIQITPTSVSLPQELTIIAQLESGTTPEAIPTLSTDKSDYFPTDTVYITGVNFLPNATYTLHISSQDNPIFNFRPEVTSDENGHISFSFKLDGNYRPNYNIDALDLSGKNVATYAFTDAPIETVVDSAGVNDEPGQKDLTRLTRDLGSANPLLITWNWDEIKMSGGTQRTHVHYLISMLMVMRTFLYVLHGEVTKFNLPEAPFYIVVMMPTLTGVAVLLQYQ